MKYVIEIQNLTKYYGKSRGVEDLSLTVAEGETFGFIGPNGAGKSTTIRTLMGLIKPTSGTVRVLGMDVCSQLPSILGQVGYLPSESAFYPGMKVSDILKLSAGMRKKDCRQEAQRLCERLELDISRKAEDLSFGNRKKVSIVCALQHNPRLLILDEPTSGLDPLMQREFFAILRKRNRQGTTVFLSSHILSEVQRNCERAAVIRDGRLITCDRVQAMSQTGARRVTIHGTADVSGLDGIRDFTSGENSQSFLFSGDMNQLLGRLSAGNIEDLSVTEPDLEEIFLHYYTDGGEQQ